MPSPAAPTLKTLATKLASGATSSRQLADECLARIGDASGEGARAFVHVDPAAVRQAADAMDQLRKAGHAPSPYAGIPLAIKDLADIQGQPTRAGSKVMGESRIAMADAPVVARLRAAGFLLIGRANMTEFAYSGLGINPHYGTPLSPWDRASKRVPGGSSSGSGVAVADRMAYGALGTDTGGSCRIPAAFNGVVGYKPTARRVPTSGVVPLSTSLDSIGPLASSVGCCQILDAVMAGGPVGAAASVSLQGMRLLVPENLVLAELDAHVSGDFERALGALAKAGAQITRAKLQAFELIAAANKFGGLSGAESFHWHRELIAQGAAQYDRRVLARIHRGKEQTAADYLDLLAAREAAIQAFNAETAGYDAVVSPTVPVVAPKIADCEPDAEYNRINMLVLRNTMMLNVVDGCSIALPMHRTGAAPTSLMVSGAAMTDHRVMAIAAAAEAALAA